MSHSKSGTRSRNSVRNDCTMFRARRCRGACQQRSKCRQRRCTRERPDCGSAPVRRRRVHVEIRRRVGRRGRRRHRSRPHRGRGPHRRRARPLRRGRAPTRPESPPQTRPPPPPLPLPRPRPNAAALAPSGAGALERGEWSDGTGGWEGLIVNWCHRRRVSRGSRCRGSRAGPWHLSVQIRARSAHFGARFRTTPHSGLRPLPNDPPIELQEKLPELTLWRFPESGRTPFPLRNRTARAYKLELCLR